MAQKPEEASAVPTKWAQYPDDLTSVSSARNYRAENEETDAAVFQLQEERINTIMNKLTSFLDKDNTQPFTASQEEWLAKTTARMNTQLQFHLQHMKHLQGRPLEEKGLEVENQLRGLLEACRQAKVKHEALQPEAELPGLSFPGLFDGTGTERDERARRRQKIRTNEDRLRMHLQEEQKRVAEMQEVMHQQQLQMKEAMKQQYHQALEMSRQHEMQMEQLKKELAIKPQQREESQQQVAQEVNDYFNPSTYTQSAQNAVRQQISEQPHDHVTGTETDPAYNNLWEEVGALREEIRNIRRQPNQPIQDAQQQARDDRFYRSLPTPWNVVPVIQTGANKGLEVLKLWNQGLMPKFNHRKANYIRWRSTFIANVHMLMIPIQQKLFALEAALESDPLTNAIFTGMARDNEAYRELIQVLETSYGGEIRLMEQTQRAIEELPVVRVGDLAGLKQLNGLLTAYLGAARQKGTPVGSGMFTTLANKLDTTLRREFSEKLAHSKKEPSMSTLVDWLNITMAGWNMLDDMKKNNAGTIQQKKPERSNYHEDSEEDSGLAEQLVQVLELEEAEASRRLSAKEDQCGVCNKPHLLRECKVIEKMTPRERHVLIAGMKRCFKCLRPGHGVSKCKSKITCKHCKGNHNTLLHRQDTEKDKIKTTDAMTDSESENNEVEQVKAISANQAQMPSVAVSVIPLWVCNQKTKKKELLNALLDSGSTATLLSKGVADRLGLDGPETTQTVHGAVGMTTRVPCMQATAKLMSYDHKTQKTVVIKVFEEAVGQLWPVDWTTHKGNFAHLKNIPFHPIDASKKVDLIVGQTEAELMRSLCADVFGKVGEPIARCTPLGWVASGYTAAGTKVPGGQCVLVENDQLTIARATVEWQPRLNRGGVPLEMYLKGKPETKDGNNTPQDVKEQKTLMNKVNECSNKLDDHDMKRGCCKDTCPLHGILSGQGGSECKEKRKLDDHDMKRGCCKDTCPLHAILSGQGGPKCKEKQMPDGHDSQRGCCKDTCPLCGILSGQESEAQEVAVNISLQDWDKLTKKVLEQWVPDPLPEEEHYGLSESEAYCVELLKKERTFIQGHYQMPVLWRRNEPSFPPSEEYALKRMYANERHNLCTEEVWLKYNQIITDYEMKGYIKKIDPQSVQSGYYLAHFAVVKQESTTTKVRVVFDGKAKVKGKSLNDACLAGPNLLNPLPEVLMRFRKWPVALVGDIAEMYLQILMHEKDRPFHRFVHRCSPDAPVEHWEWTRHTFGNKGSPAVAIATIKMHAEEHQHEFPLATETVLKSSLMDDNLDSYKTSDEAKEARKQWTELFQLAGMQCRKYISNDSQVLSSIPEELREKKCDFLDITGSDEDDGLNETKNAKTLGIKYFPQDDYFQFQLKLPEKFKDEQEWTKRKVLCVFARLYDPLGLISPYTISARLIFQRLWKEAYTWDTKLEEEHAKPWRDWLQDATNLSGLRISRCLTPVPYQEGCVLRLHAFSDASEEAVASAVYLQTVHEEQGVLAVNLIASKAKLAPLKDWSWWQLS